jgi:hypothetical protein
VLYVPAKFVVAIPLNETVVIEGMLSLTLDPASTSGGYI